MTEINYNFGANNSTLDDVTSLIGGIQEVQQDISNLFNVLYTVYEGAGATALQHAQNSLNGMLEDVLQNMTITGQQASEQQQAMQALDAQNAAQF
jgi:uncharacterized protein YukE